MLENSRVHSIKHCTEINVELYSTASLLVILLTTFQRKLFLQADLQPSVLFTVAFQSDFFCFTLPLSVKPQYFYH